MKDMGIPDTTRKADTGATVQGRSRSRQCYLPGIQSQAEGTAPGGGSGSSRDSAGSSSSVVDGLCLGWEGWMPCVQSTRSHIAER